MVTTLQGSKVRHRIAEMGWSIERAGEVSGIPHGTLKNNTRPENPQPIKLSRAYDLLRALNQPGFEPWKIEDILSPGCVASLAETATSSGPDGPAGAAA